MLINDVYIDISPKLHSINEVGWCAKVVDVNGVYGKLLFHEHVTPSDDVDHWSSYEQALQACINRLVCGQ